MSKHGHDARLAIAARMEPARPVLIAGPTASGKSALALAIAETQGRAIVNADALQVFSDWRVLTARPSPEEETRAAHRLYGHVPGDRDYSVGTWLSEVAPLLHADPAPVIVGGTGLYFAALTEGLAPVPPVPAGIRAIAETRLEESGIATLLAELDEATVARIDTHNPARVRRAWEVLSATGRGLAAWQADTPPALLPLDNTHAFVMTAPKDWLTPRIEQRLHRMIETGALDEARAFIDRFPAAEEPDRHSPPPAAKAIGADELIAHLRGEMTLEDALVAAAIRTRQYAKRQRTWFRARMGAWDWLDGQTLA